MGGQSETATSAATSGIRHGAMARDVASKLILAILAVANRTTPTGGAMVPIIRLSTKISGDWAAARREQEHPRRLLEIVRVGLPRAGVGAAGVGGFKTAMKLLGIIDDNAMALLQRTLEGEAIGRGEEILAAIGAVTGKSARRRAPTRLFLSVHPIAADQRVLLELVDLAGDRRRALGQPE